MIKNQKGFALVITLSLLPALLAGFFLSWAAIAFIRQDLGIKYSCRAEGIAGQKKVAPLLEKLLALNSKAKKLKLKLNLAEAALAIAPDPASRTAAKAKVESIKLERQVLDMQQKGIILNSNALLSVAHTKTRLAIRGRVTKLSNTFLSLGHSSVNGRAPTLAVRPDYADTAPTYSPAPDFSTTQALAHEWHYSAQLAAPYSYFLPGNFEFRKACAVTLISEGKKWIPQITKARFSLKSVW